jgi:hypothetical protein
MSRFKNKRDKKGQSRTYSDKEKEFFAQWDAYFGSEKFEQAGSRWSLNPTFHLLNTKSKPEDRLYLLRWFENLFRGFCNQTTWVMECGLIYSIDKEAMKIYFMKSHPSLMRKVQHINTKVWDARVRKLVDDKLDERVEWSRGGHWSYFHQGNIFFLSYMGYEIEDVDIAPGWWYNCGVNRVHQSFDSTLTGFGDSNAEEVVDAINVYRNTEITRIAERLWDVMNGKYPGNKIFEAVLHEDSTGVKWQP